jgi:hypothetical protein
MAASLVSNHKGGCFLPPPNRRGRNNRPFTLYYGVRPAQNSRINDDVIWQGHRNFSVPAIF